MILKHDPFQFFMPGRLCLFGEHSDWTGEQRDSDPNIIPGYCLITGTNQGLKGRAEPLKGAFYIESKLPDGSFQGPYTIEWSRESLIEAAKSGRFYQYAAGTAAVIHERYKIDGLKLMIDTMNLPVKKGLSSSAAICTLTAEAFSHVYGLQLDNHTIMDTAYQGEILTGSKCGRMDQACVFGQKVTLLKFDGSDLSVHTVHPANSLHLLIVDLNRKKNTRKILSDLNHAFVRIDTLQGQAIREALGNDNQIITTSAFEAIKSGNAKEIGRLMAEAQSVFDRKIAPCCPDELDAPVLHGVLNDFKVKSMSLGGKGVGSQGDGCAQFICEESNQRNELAKYIRRQYDMICLPLTIPGLT